MGPFEITAIHDGVRARGGWFRLVLSLALGLWAVSGRAQSAGTTDAPGQGTVRAAGTNGTAAAKTTLAAGSRVWTRTDGVKVTGVFVAWHGSVLALKDVGGRNVFWSWAQVSQADRSYLAREKAVFGPPSAPPPAPSRQQVVAQRMAQVAVRATLTPAPAEAALPGNAAEESAVRETTEQGSER